MDFDTIIDRRGSHCSKWDIIERKFGVSPKDGLSMWTADSDYPTAPCVIDAVRAAADHGIFGYFADPSDYHDAVQWWMKTRHGWEIDTDWILTAQGLGNVIASCFDIWSEPGDHIATFNPVYHEFRLKAEKSGRGITEFPLVREGDTYHMDLEDAAERLTGKEKILLFCSPQNPSGRVWTRDELRAVAAFAEAHDLLLISDEIHHDIVYPGNTFVPMDVAAPEYRHRMVVATGASKTFNIAGQKTGNVIIPDEKLRAAFQYRLRSLDYGPGRLAVEMITAAYSPAGADWADAQVAYLDGNRALFDAGVNAIPGVHSLPLQSTFLAWVDFEGTGMSYSEISRRVRKEAKIAPSPGPEFGAGGELFQRFNFAMPRSRIQDAVDRLQRAFGDLQ